MTETLSFPVVAVPAGVTAAAAAKKAKWFAEFATFQWDPELKRGFEAEAAYWAAVAKSAAFVVEAGQFALAA